MAAGWRQHIKTHPPHKMSLALTRKPEYLWRMVDRNQLMLDVRDQAIAARITLYTLAKDAKVSGTVITRWINKLNGKDGNVPSLKTIGKLERTLATSIQRQKEKDNA